MKWISREAYPLSPSNLQALFNNRTPAVRIPDFASAGECRAFAASFRLRKLRYVRGSSAHASASFDAQRIGYIGLTQFEFKYRTLDEYLEESERSTEEVDAVFAESFDPVTRLLDRLRVESRVAASIAGDGAGGRRYAHSIIRNSNQGLALHADFAPYQARMLEVAAADAQLAWNFYAEVPPGPGGDTTVHNSPWTWQPDHVDQVPENYPLDPALVDGAETFTFTPNPGEVVMFNSRNPHQVSPVQLPGESVRIAMATFIGRMPSGELKLWS